MILPSFTEQQILKELVADRKVVANQAKKIASMLVTRKRKGLSITTCLLVQVLGLDGVKEY
jgi:hypothetical protein